MFDIYYFILFLLFLLGQLNDSRIEKGDPSKGDTIKSDINNDTEGTLFIFFIFYCLFHNFSLPLIYYFFCVIFYKCSEKMYMCLVYTCDIHLFNINTYFVHLYIFFIRLLMSYQRVKV